ncbi:MAG: hypothetical protein HY552_06555 [Elusimicrobia bacterium]|nr:hypothetical protein [Elusimicrobiota bacterium]
MFAVLACLGLLGMPGLPGWAGEAPLVAESEPAAPIAIAHLQASLADVGTSILSPEDGLTWDHLNGLEAAMRAPQAHEAMAAKVLAAALCEPGFIGTHRSRLERLFGGKEQLGVLEAKAATLAAATDTPSRESVRRMRARIVPHLADLNTAILSTGRSLDGDLPDSGDAPASPAEAEASASAAGAGEVAARRTRFNDEFSPEKQKALNRVLRDRIGRSPDFSVSPTPVFLPRVLLDRMLRYIAEMSAQLMTPEYLAAATEMIPAAFRVPGRTPHPLFTQWDFGLVHDEAGNLHLQPKVIELQGFPSIMEFMNVLGQAYQEVYGLDGLQYFLSGLDLPRYEDLMRRAIVGDHAPDNVVLLEINPFGQKTLADFLATEKLLGIKILSVTDVVPRGDKLYYRRGRTLVPIERIFNRVIFDQLARDNVRPSFDLTKAWDVTWAGHPHWFYLWSKFALAHLKHVSVPLTQTLDQIAGLGRMTREDLMAYVLKPLFSYGGAEVTVGPRPWRLTKVRKAERPSWALQQRVKFAPFIATPYGETMAEVRIMSIWLDAKLPLPVITLLRMTQGAKAGVDFNKKGWVGVTLAMFDPD